MTEQDKKETPTADSVIDAAGLPAAKQGPCKKCFGRKIVGQHYLPARPAYCECVRRGK